MTRFAKTRLGGLMDQGYFVAWGRWLPIRIVGILRAFLSYSVDFYRKFATGGGHNTIEYQPVTEMASEADSGS